jgi:prepilin-type N-terminal cleavage/methylation domain-containing protein
MNKVVKSLRKLHKGQGGVTLIELLVVVVILGVIAAIVVLNVGGFIGTGKEEAANTEAHQVQTAIIACMAADNCTLGTTIDSATTGGPAGFLLNPALLQASYTYDSTSGEITGASATSGGKWDGCAFASGKWTCP